MGNVIDPNEKFSRDNRYLPEREESDFYCEEKNVLWETFDKFNDDWIIADKGSMFNRRSAYVITFSRLCEDDWILHLSGKAWFDANTFIPAYFEACTRAGIAKVIIRTHY